MTGVGDVRTASNKLNPIDHAVFINCQVHANKLHRFILPVVFITNCNFHTENSIKQCKLLEHLLIIQSK